LPLAAGGGGIASAYETPLDGREHGSRLPGDGSSRLPRTLASNLRDYWGAPEPAGDEPLTGEAVAQALKRYAAEAGVDPDSITVHSLRHLRAELYYAASGDVHETQRFLDHGRLETTSIYLQQLTGEDHRCWQAMANKLGV
jgi:integrase